MRSALNPDDAISEFSEVLAHLSLPYTWSVSKATDFHASITITMPAPSAPITHTSSGPHLWAALRALANNLIFDPRLDPRLLNERELATNPLLRRPPA